MDSRTLRLLQAVEGFLDDPPKGTPASVTDGLQTLSDGLRSGGEQGPPTPGQETVKSIVGSNAYERANEIDASQQPTPGQRVAMSYGSDN